LQKPNNKPYTDLGILIGNTQCESFGIFLPLRFYMKSILVIMNPQKIAIFTIWPALNFEFLHIFDIFKGEIPKKSKYKASKIVQMTVFDPQKSVKIDFT